MRILIADDEPLARYTIRSLIEEVGHPRVECILEAADIRELKETAFSREVDIVFLDIKMPGGSGLDAMTRILRERSDILFVVVTSYADFGFAKTALELGARGYLLKPPSREEVEALLGRLEETLTRRRGERRKVLHQWFVDLHVLPHSAASSHSSLPDGIPEHPIPLFLFHPALSYPKCKEPFEAEGERLLAEGDMLLHFPSPYGVDLCLFRRDEGTVQSTLLHLVHRLPEWCPEVDPLLLVGGAASSSRDVAEFYGEAVRLLPFVALFPSERILPLRVLQDASRTLLLGDRETFETLFSIVRALVERNEVGFLDAVEHLVSRLPHLEGRILSYVEQFLRRYMGIERPASSLTAADFSSCPLASRMGMRSRDEDHDPVRRALAFVKEHYTRPLSVSMVASYLNLTPNYFSFLFHRRTGKRFSEYLMELRLIKARDFLLSGYSVKEAALAVGYASVRHFSRMYRRFFGRYPSEEARS
ncbi:helix-turn-helix domain-containing protein [Spirochaeta thermophila]|uniref:Two component transcriptional regulator, AraC family n=1 Tax=Winmispira thermophila (strain ATCC 49972 / DSM 6192 / RI 19.B1) TaxID=665571 RepID=E0RRZ3_WINT6|nr:helix-turn-helix domain-containing protein [Spirochaeta thermophila]ADN01780.1 hypothetical protein STHERM_c08310 [Spirochaeta thermophila DSM 6192]